MEINERITKVLEYSGFSASEFADEIDVQRSSISHIISGRNKPSLEFVTKIKNRFPELSWDWIILGTGEMKQTDSPFPISEKQEENSTPDLFTLIDEDYKNEVAFGAWLKKIIVNRSIDFYKKNNHFKTEDFDTTLYKIEEKNVDVSENNLFNELKIKQILDTINSLKYNYRMVLTLFYIEGYDSQEISEILKISYSNCRTISSAKDSLRKKLEEL